MHTEFVSYCIRKVFLTKNRLDSSSFSFNSQKKKDGPYQQTIRLSGNFRKDFPTFRLSSFLHFLGKWKDFRNAFENKRKAFRLSNFSEKSKVLYVHIKGIFCLSNGQRKILKKMKTNVGYISSQNFFPIEGQFPCVYSTS